MRTFNLLAALGAAGLFAGAAAAQTISIGTNPQGSLAFASGTAVSKVMVEKTGLQFRVAPFGGSSTYLPMISRGEIDFGFANQGETAFAYKGIEIFKGRPNRNLRQVGVLYRINGTFGVPTASPIKKMRFFPARLAASRASSAFLNSSSRDDASHGYVANPPLMVSRPTPEGPSVGNC